MILYEFEGKKLLSEAGIAVPNSQLIDSKQLDSSGFALRMTGEVVLKAQVLSGKRADAGGILFADNDSELKTRLSKLLGNTINNEKVESVLVEEKVKFEKEYYLSLSYDTDERAPVLTYSESGGTGIEEREVKKVVINPLDPTKILKLVQDKSGIDQDVLEKLINLFFAQDCLLLEVNPLVKTSSVIPESNNHNVIPDRNAERESSTLDSGSSVSGMTKKETVRNHNSAWMALDAKIKLDEAALGRHKDEWNFSPRSAPGHTPTKSEIEAKKIDEGDYRGVAGSAFFELDGDIAIMSSGGGASLTALDALLLEGGKPANYTEYSGNPPKEKVLKLTKVVLSKPNLHGLWIVGAVANFTDVYETLSGIIDGLRELEKEMNTKFDFPIVIRRGGPRDKEAFDMLKQVKDFDLHLYGEETSITQAAKIITDLAKKYASQTSS